jgi:ACR3 family arsenite transporter
MGSFERNLTWWVFGCIAAGIALGQLFPAFFQAVGSLKLAEVNLPVAALIWLMIVPMLLKVDFGAMHEVKRHSRGIGVTLFINWAVKPFSMALLGWLFVRHVFARWLPADQLDSYIAAYLLAAAPCTAMSLYGVISPTATPISPQPSGTQRRDHAVAFAPLVGLLGVSAIKVPWETLALSVGCTSLSHSPWRSSGEQSWSRAGANRR